MKIYPSIREELARKKIFVASALKIYAHNMAFKMGLVKHFLKMNHFADNTPQEMSRMYTRVGHSQVNNNDNNNNIDNIDINNGEENSEAETLVGLSQEQLREELARIVMEKEPGYELIVEQLKIKLDDRTKNERKMQKATSRQTTVRPNRSRLAKKTKSKSLVKQMRQQPIDELGDFGNVSMPEEGKKYVKKVPSTNKNYTPIELVSQSYASYNGYLNGHGLSEKELQDLELEPRVDYVKDQLSSALNLGGEKEETNGVADMEIDTEDPIMNQVYLDWRESGCLSVPRDQGLCNSCYAFAYVSLMEWWHCRQTGKLVPFSEQYMVDCGKYAGMSGCMGGNMPGIGKFIMDWGVELRSNYPYLAKDTVCPYDPHEWDHAGYKRPIISRYTTAVNMAMWPLVLKHSGPIIVSVRIPRDFQFYGGLVHNGDNCALTPDGFVHAMLLVGHGIDEGQEYWLLRNSHGYQWGDSGYFKLSKQANADCFMEANEAEFDFISQNMHPIETYDGINWRKVSPSEAHLRGMAGKDLNEVKVFY